jgi:hypothetical protein
MFAMGCNTIGDLGILGEIFRCLACAYDGRCPAYRGRTRGNYLLTQILSGIFQGILRPRADLLYRYDDIGGGNRDSDGGALASLR